MSFYNVVNRASLAAGQPEDVSQVLANLDAIASILNGGLDNSNITALAAIARSKLDFGSGLVNTDIAAGAAIGLAKIAGPILLGVRVFLASGTYTPTAGTRAVYIECIGGGGGGGGAAATAAAQAALAPGGGGGAYAASFLTAGFSGIAYTIGAGGAGGVAGANSGGNGGDTIFGANVIVAKGSTGGAGGFLQAGVAAGNNGGLGQAGNIGDLVLAGGGGGPSFYLTTTAGQLGGGGGTVFSPPARNIMLTAGTALGDGAASAGMGGGGRGNSASQAAGAGAAGAAGLIRVWEFA